MIWGYSITRKLGWCDMAKVTVKINHGRVAAKIKAGAGAMIVAVTEQVLADCQEYVPQDQNVLRASAAVNTSVSSKYSPGEKATERQLADLSGAEGSDVKKGEIVWDMPYARKRYFTGTPSHNKNKKASILWCEVAHAAHGEDWQKIAQKSFLEGMET